MLLHEDGTDEAQDGGLVGKDADDVVRRLISALGRSIGLVELIFGQWWEGKRL
jgi:hypothetical protein